MNPRPLPPLVKNEQVGRRASGLFCNGSTGLLRSNLAGKSAADCDGEVILGSPSSACGGHSGSNVVVFAEEGAAVDDGGGRRLLLKRRAMGSDDSTARRADGDGTKPPAWPAGKVDCPGDTDSNANKSLPVACAGDPNGVSCSVRFGSSVLLGPSDTTLSASQEVNRQDVLNTRAGEDDSPPRNLPQGELQAAAKLFELATIQTASDFLHQAERSCRKSKASSMKLDDATERGLSTGALPTAGEPLLAPAQGCWPCPRRRSLPATSNSASFDKDKGKACKRHGLSACVLCSGPYLSLAGGSASSNTQPGNASAESAGGVNTIAFAASGSVGVTGQVSYGSLLVVRERPPQDSGGAVISRRAESMTCDRHLLPDCVLCKIRHGCLGKLAPISALGLGHDSSGESNAPLSSRSIVSKPVAINPQGNYCERHGLDDCLPCGDLDFTARGRKPDRADNRTVYGAVEPLLPEEHLLNVCRSNNPSPLLEVYPISAPRAKGYSSPAAVPLSTGALSAETPGASCRGPHLCRDPTPLNVVHGVYLGTVGESPEMTERTGGGHRRGGAETTEKRERDDEEHDKVNISSSRRSRFPPTAGWIRSGISRYVSDDALGRRHSHYPSQAAEGDLGDTARGMGRGSGERRRRAKPLAWRIQPRSNADDHRPGGAVGDIAASVARRRERGVGVNDLAARALAAALEVL